MRKLTFYHIFHEQFVQEGFLWVKRRQIALPFLGFSAFPCFAAASYNEAMLPFSMPARLALL